MRVMKDKRALVYVKTYMYEPNIEECYYLLPRLVVCSLRLRLYLEFFIY